MLTIKNGRIHSAEFSFALPEDMSFYYDSGIELRDCLQFLIVSIGILPPFANSLAERM